MELAVKHQHGLTQFTGQVGKFLLQQPAPAQEIFGRLQHMMADRHSSEHLLLKTRDNYAS
jgi:hypothetical protein